MTNLFIRIYLSILLILFLAWWIHGMVFQIRNTDNRSRVIARAHQGGARLVAKEIEDRGGTEGQVTEIARKYGFSYPISIKKRADLPDYFQNQIRQDPEGVWSFNLGFRDYVITGLSDKTQYVELGPFPDYNMKAIEDSIEPWLLIATEKVNKAENKENATSDLAKLFGIPVVLKPVSELSDDIKIRMIAGEKTIVYMKKFDEWYAYGVLDHDDRVLAIGSFIRFERIDTTVAATTLALVLLPVALAIAFLIRPLAFQLRRIEEAARRFAKGEFSFRVDESRSGSTLQLAKAFNEMSSRIESLLRSKEELLQAVSHELRTPLARMQFSVDLIASSGAPDKQQQRLRELDQSIIELNELVDELLRYSKLESTDLKPKVEWVDLIELGNSIIEKFEGLYPSIDFQFREPNAPSASAYMERISIHRVISNLISNASRFAKSHVRLTIQILEKHVTFLVEDDGPGIPLHERKRVLEPFVRLNESRMSHDGVGLGLAIVSRILFRTGGSIEIRESEDLKGAAIFVSMHSSSSSHSGD